jgi:hypothetical protein
MRKSYKKLHIRIRGNYFYEVDKNYWLDGEANNGSTVLERGTEAEGKSANILGNSKYYGQEDRRRQS